MVTSKEILVIADNNPNGLAGIVLIALLTFIIVNIVSIRISKRKAQRLEEIKKKIARRYEQLEYEREMEVNRNNAKDQNIRFDR